MTRTLAKKSDCQIVGAKASILLIVVFLALRSVDRRLGVDSGLPSLMQTYHPSADRASRTPAQDGRQDRASHFAST